MQTLQYTTLTKHVVVVAAMTTEPEEAGGEHVEVREDDERGHEGRPVVVLPDDEVAQVVPVLVRALVHLVERVTRNEGDGERNWTKG